MLNNKQPLVSIIMLTYNRAEYISMAIQSVIDQKYENWELLILDDGSTDDTASIVSIYTDPRIKYLHDSVNKGLAHKRAESLSFAKGTYIAILDSDDIWTDPTKIKAQVAYLESNPLCAVVGTQITLIDGKGVQIGTNKYSLNDQKIRKKILTRNQFAHSSVMMRKRLTDKTEGYRILESSEDLDLYLQLGKLGTFANLPDTCLAYRVHAQSATASKLKVLQGVLETIKVHRHGYPKYWIATLKFSLMILAVKLNMYILNTKLWRR